MDSGSSEEGGDRVRLDVLESRRDLAPRLSGSRRPRSRWQAAAKLADQADDQGVGQGERASEVAKRRAVVRLDDRQRPGEGCV